MEQAAYILASGYGLLGVGIGLWITQDMGSRDDDRLWPFWMAAFFVLSGSRVFYEFITAAIALG